MSELPKLRLAWFNACPGDEITCDLGQAKYLVFGYVPSVLVFVEGQPINSYEKLVQLTAQKEYKDMEALRVVLVEDLIGDG